MPNAGKSTLLTALTNAKPKIAAYPFTTLEPNLGVAQVDDETTVVLADIPGLIEGAAEGAGLGHDFLRHIQRTRVLIHLVDGLSADPLADFSQINSELALFDPNLREEAADRGAQQDRPAGGAGTPEGDQGELQEEEGGADDHLGAGAHERTRAAARGGGRCWRRRLS